MSRPLYSIPILNELHELYPDLLYRPSRFLSGNDVITYITERGIRRPFLQESRRYSQPQPQTQTHTQSIFTDEFDIIMYGGRVAPRIYPSPATVSNASDVTVPNSTTNSAMNPNANEFIPLLAPSPIDQLLSYFIRENMIDANFSMSDIPLQPLRPTENQLREHTTVQTLIENPEANCAICQDAMTVGQTTRRLHHCQHTFHLSCVDAWFSSHPTCPTCRHDIRLE